ncbi:HDL181Cp [Eremothecium sinecaudum]|uniref:HDL181Cp n=1 Tax=Eremothecium sinecaudum TaxID=45286 RepID=A0A109UYV0_9SACH|nr:HDL181Cp [Eremothecium sinecaudum]AMD20563.1 HDL181Cp [Eremothecium sinecaudum]
MGVTKKSKRNKLSFVCQTCRKSKTKCDKLKPSCTGCIKYGYICVYDVETQARPKSRSKDSRILQLRRELEYWKSKAMGYSNQWGLNLLEWPKMRPIIEDSCPNDPVVNFHSSFPMLVLEGQCKHSTSPFSALSYMGKDVYLFLFWSSISPRMSAAETKLRIEKMARSTNSPNAARFVRRLLYGREKQNSRYTIDEFRTVCSEFNHIEDSCGPDFVYSEKFKSIKDFYEANLPKLDVIRLYLRYFYREVYPLLPLLEIPLFEEVIREVLVDGAEYGTNLHLNFGNTELRKKLVHIFLLAFILGITDISMEVARARGIQLDLDPLILSFVKVPGTDRMFGLMNYTLTTFNIVYWVDEYTMLTHLYRYVYSMISAELAIPCEMDPVDSHDMISWYSNVIGLDTFPDDLEASTLNDARLLNLRRKLWLGVEICCNYERRSDGRRTQHLSPSSEDDSSVKFSHSQEDFKIERFLQKAYSDNLLEYNILLAFYQKHKYCFVGTVLDLAYIRLDNSSVKLSDANRALNECRRVAEQLILSSRVKKNMSFKFEGLYDIQVDLVKSYNTHFYHSRIILMETCVLTTSSLYLYFEGQLTKDNNPGAAVHYNTYFKQAFHDVIEATIFAASYLEGEVDLLPGAHFVTYYMVENMMVRCLQVVFGIMLRLCHAEEVVWKCLYNCNQYSSQKAMSDMRLKLESRFRLVRQIKGDLQNFLTIIHDLVSKWLRWTLFSCFKRLLTFDLALDMIQEEKIMKFLHAPNRERLAHWGLKSNLEVMESTNIFITAELGYLEGLCGVLNTLNVKDFNIKHQNPMRKA